MPAEDSHPCPVGCQATFYSVDAVIHHVQSFHILREDVCPDDVWLRGVNRRQCPRCKRLIARRATQCSACTRQLREQPSQGPRSEGTPLSQPEPQMSPSIADVLKARRGVMDHVPMGCRAAVLAALARCLEQFCDRQT